jgi:hypothetical protein
MSKEIFNVTIVPNGIFEKQLRLSLCLDLNPDYFPSGTPFDEGQWQTWCSGIVHFLDRVNMRQKLIEAVQVQGNLSFAPLKFKNAPVVTVESTDSKIDPRAISSLWKAFLGLGTVRSKFAPSANFPPRAVIHRPYYSEISRQNFPKCDVA